MINLEIYEKTRSVPQNAQKVIAGGKLKGFTDINPMWRIKTLTELFGVCGIGWYPETVKKWVEDGANGEKAAFCEINLYIKQGGEWSKPINGTGGAMLVSVQKEKLVTNDEAFKMAYTDAISSVCKLLGFGADIYWDKDRTKYDAASEGATKEKGGKNEEIQGYGGNMDNIAHFEEPQKKPSITANQLKVIGSYSEELKKSILKSYKIKALEELTLKDASGIITKKKKADAERAKEKVAQ